MMHKKQRKQNKMSSILKGLQLNELSNKKLGKYKTAAGKDASKADGEGDYKRGDKRYKGITTATKKEFANDANGLKEDFEDMPNELMDPQAWKSLDIRQKYKALVGAGLITAGNFLEKKWMNDDGTEFPIDHPFAPEGLRDGRLDLNRIYRSAQADYQDRTHSSNVTSQDRENELTIGAEGRAELKRKADELSELKREKLRNERLADEATAFQRAETVQQRKDEMQKIADQYKHDLTIIDKEHSNNMEAIKTSNKFELDKLDKEYADAQREREFKSGESDKEFRDRNKDRDFRAGESDKEFRDRNKDREFRAGESDKDYADRQREREQQSGESDKDYADRQREREHQPAMADKEREQSRPEPEEPRPRPQRPSSGAGNNFDQDTGEPIKPQQSNQWHTSQQVGYTPTKPSYTPTKPNKDDDVTDVEPKPNKPLALGNSLKENSSSIFIGLVLAERMVMGVSTDASGSGTIAEEDIDEDWQKTNKKDKTDGMSRKAVKAYRRENPGSKLKTAVTTKPSKLKKGSKSAKRRKSFCARMSGMKKSRASAKTKRDPDSPINKALRRWNCESIEQLHELMMIAEQKVQQLREAANPAQQAAIAISMKKKGQKPKQESSIIKGLVDENLGTPYPGTYEQETAPIRRPAKQERVMKIAFEGKKNASR